MHGLGLLQLLGHLFFHCSVDSNQLLILSLNFWNQKLKAFYFLDKLVDLGLVLLLFLALSHYLVVAVMWKMMRVVL
mgnify:CR=1 FL=1